MSQIMEHENFKKLNMFTAERVSNFKRLFFLLSFSFYFKLNAKVCVSKWLNEDIRALIKSGNF